MTPKPLSDEDHPWVRALVVTKRARKLSWREIEERSGVHRRTIVRWFSTGGKSPSIHTFKRVSDALGLQMTFSIDRTWEKEPSR